MKPTRRTQPLRKGIAQRTAAYAAAQRGTTANGTNPMDQQRQLAVKRPPGTPKPSGAFDPPGPKPTPMPRRTGGGNSSLGRAIRERNGRAIEQAAGRVQSGSRGKPFVNPEVALRQRPRTFQTTRGKRRLSFAEAYARRTTDTSRARVEELYGRKAGPKLRAGATADRSLAPGEEKLRGASGSKPYKPIDQAGSRSRPRRRRRRSNGTGGVRAPS